MSAALRGTLRSAMALAWLLAGTAVAQPRAGETANDDVARGLFEAGTAAYKAGNYGEALQLYEQAYARSPRPALLYNIGQVADRLRDDRKALASFEAYLDQLPNAPNRAEVEHRIDALKEARKALGAPATTPPSPVGPTSRAPTPAQAAAQGGAKRPPEAAAVVPAGVDTRGAAGGSGAVTSQWWFWTGVGAVLLAGAAVGLAVALASGPGPAAPYQGNGGSLRGP